MLQVLKRPQAETDLDDIWWYIAQDNPDNADRFLDAFLMIDDELLGQDMQDFLIGGNSDRLC